MNKFFIFIIILIIGLNAKSQSVNPFVIASSGGYYITTNTQLSWTLGEVVTSTFTSGNSIITQGFQQNTYVVNTIDVTSDNPYLINVYPNPTSKYINIQWDNIEQTDLIISITNNQGVSILKKTVKSNEKQIEIDLSIFSNSSYLLCVTSSKREWNKLFKIIKY